MLTHCEKQLLNFIYIYIYHLTVTSSFLKGCRFEEGRNVPVLCSPSWERKKKKWLTEKNSDQSLLRTLTFLSDESGRDTIWHGLIL